MNFFCGEVSPWAFEAAQAPEARRIDAQVIDAQCLREEQSWEEISTRERFCELSHDEAEAELVLARTAILGSSGLHQVV